MSGLIFGGMMKGLGEGVSGVGRMMADQGGRDEIIRARQEERRADLSERRAPAGPFQAGISEGSMTEEMAAARMNMSVPEFRKFREAQRSGDTSGYEQEVESRVAPQGPDTSDPSWNEATEKSKQKPAGFDAWQKDKRKALADIAAELTFGDKYDEVVKGRRGQQEIDASEKAMAEPGKAGIIGQGMAAGEGKPLNTQGVNSFTGEPNKVGESVITRNERPPAPRPAAGGGNQDDANARAQVASLRSQVLAKETNLAALRKGVMTAEKRATVAAAEREIAELQGRLRTAEARLGPRGASGDNGIVKPPAPSRPPLSEIFK